MSRETGRNKGAELIRIIASILVILGHVSAHRTSVSPFALCCNMLAFNGVALFFMLSGAFYLAPERQYGVRHAVLHRFVRLFALYYFWKAFYLAVSLFTNKTQVTDIKEQILLPMIRHAGHYHLWFLPAMAIVSLLFPLVRDGAAKKPVLRLYLVVFFAVAILLPTLFLYEFPFKYLLMEWFTLYDFLYFAGYLGYVLLGRYLYAYARSFSPFVCALLYAAAVLSYLFACTTAIGKSTFPGSGYLGLSTPFSLHVFFVSAAAFTTVLRMKQESRLFRGKTLQTAAGLTFGIYLLHPLFLDALANLSLPDVLPVPLMIPLLVVFLFVVSGAVTAVLQRIPFVRALVR